MKNPLLLAVFILWTSASIAQSNRLTIDLATPGKYEQTIERGTIDTLWLINKLVADNVFYQVTVHKTGTLQTPFNTDVLQTPSREQAVLRIAEQPQQTGPCAGLLTAIQQLKTETIESNISHSSTLLKAAIAGADEASCKGEIATARHLISGTMELKKLPQKITMRTGETLTITVSRKVIEEADESIVWEYKFITPKNSWQVFYGFTYSPDVINPESTYFTQPDAGNGTYTLTRGSHSGNRSLFKNLTPTLLFSYFLTRKSTDLKAAVSGGISLDLSKPSAMISPSVVIGDNLSINIGLIFREKDQLLGKYHEGQIISETLEFSQLHEKVWQPELFLSIGFRFDRNPFGQDEEDD